jgi:LysM repeat protein
MAVRKFSVFIMVIVFHLVVLGVVYLSTRTDEPEVKGDPIEKPVKPKTKPPIADGGNVDKGPSSGNSGSQPVTPTPTPVKPFSGKYLIHIVKSGDSLSTIANKYKLSSKEIIDLNNIKDPNKIRLGQKFKIPIK